MDVSRMLCRIIGGRTLLLRREQIVAMEEKRPVRRLFPFDYLIGIDDFPEWGLSIVEMIFRSVRSSAKSRNAVFFHKRAFGNYFVGIGFLKGLVSGICHKSSVFKIDTTFFV